MDLVFFPIERVIEINIHILSTEKGMKGGKIDFGLLDGALCRIDNAIAYSGLNDIFEIAAKYISSIAKAHALPDGNKRTGLAVGLEYLSLNEYEITIDNELLADAVRDVVIDSISELDLADLLYSQYMSSK